ncbi:MAG: recombination mediator RecR, partial [Leuconostoc lactis]
MMEYPEPIAKLIASYTKLPGIGQKTATRLAFYTLGMAEDDVIDFS